MNAWEREEIELEKLYNAGSISLEEYNDEMKRLQREYREAAIEDAERAYHDALERW